MAREQVRGRNEPPSIFLPESVGRKIQIQRSGHLNLYLLLDASQSVKKEDFRIFKDSATLMVDRVRGQTHVELPYPDPLTAHLLQGVIFFVPQTPSMYQASWWVLGAVLGNTKDEQHKTPFSGVHLLKQGSPQRGAPNNPP